MHIWVASCAEIARMFIEGEYSRGQSSDKAPLRVHATYPKSNPGLQLEDSTVQGPTKVNPKVCDIAPRGQTENTTQELPSYRVERVRLKVGLCICTQAPVASYAMQYTYRTRHLRKS